MGILAHVGITGGIGEGKSTVLRYLREAGYRVASADELVRLELRDPDVRAGVAKVSGLRTDFSTPELLERILADDGIRRSINSVLHRPVALRLQNFYADFVEVPLLVETALQNCFEQVWVVTCGREQQVDRLVQRTGNVALTERILALQLPTTSKLPFADVIVRTNASRQRVKAYTLEAAALARIAWVANRAK